MPTSNGQEFPFAHLESTRLAPPFELITLSADLIATMQLTVT